MDSFTIKHGYELAKSKEALRTSINAILNMPDQARHAFYKSEAGRKIIKGLELEAENLKPAAADGMTWTKEDIAKTIYRLQQATYEDRQIMLQLLPGPVVSILANQLNKPPYKEYNEWTQAAKTKEKYAPKLLKSEEGTELEKASKSNPVGYQKWLQAVRAKRALKSAAQPGDRVKYKDFHHGGVEKVGYIHHTVPHGEHHIGYEPNPKAGQPGELSEKSRKIKGGHAHLISDQPGKFNGGSWHHSSAITEHLKRRPVNYESFKHTKGSAEAHPTRLPTKESIGRYHDEMKQRLGGKDTDETKKMHHTQDYSWAHGHDSTFKVGQHHVRISTTARKDDGKVEHFAQWRHPKDTRDWINESSAHTTHEHDPEKLTKLIHQGIAKDQPHVEKHLAKEKQKADEKTAKMKEFHKLHPEAARMFREHYGKKD